MPDQLQLRGGTTAEHSTFTGASKEVTVDTTKKTVVVHDGTTVGGLPLMRQDGSNSALALGSAAAPSISFAGDAITGVFSPGPNTLAGSTAGAERYRTDSSGRFLVGTSSARTNVYYTTVVATPSVQFESVGSAYNGLSLINYSASGYSPVLTLGLSASNTQGTNTAIAFTHEMGAINFTGNDGTNFRTGASIVAANDQASAWAVGDCPTRLVFSTTADGAASPTEAMRIKSNGIINFSNAPTHADNTAATAAGLAVGDVYKTALGVLMIRF